MFINNGLLTSILLDSDKWERFIMWNIHYLQNCKMAGVFDTDFYKQNIGPSIQGV